MMHVAIRWIFNTMNFHITAKIKTFYSFFSCGNKYDLKSRIQVSDSDIETLCEQCNNLISGVYKTSCKTGEGVEEMFSDIAKQLVGSNR